MRELNVGHLYSLVSNSEILSSLQLERMAVSQQLFVCAPKIAPTRGFNRLRHSLTH
jgi:hypothetical protein